MYVFGEAWNRQKTPKGMCEIANVLKYVKISYTTQQLYITTDNNLLEVQKIFFSHRKYATLEISYSVAVVSVLTLTADFYIT